MNYDDLREAEYAEKRLQAFQKREEEKQEYFKAMAAKEPLEMSLRKEVSEVFIGSNSNKYSRNC